MLHCSFSDGLVVSHLPFGPTAYFTLSNTVMRHDIPKIGTISEAYPHLIFHNFSSKLGERVSFSLFVSYEYILLQCTVSDLEHTIVGLVHFEQKKLPLLNSFSGPFWHSSNVLSTRTYLSLLIF